MVEGDLQAHGVVLAVLRDFCPSGQKHILLRFAVLYRRQAVLLSASFSFFGSVSFSFNRNKRERNEHIKNILARYSDNIFYVNNCLTCTAMTGHYC